MRSSAKTVWIGFGVVAVAALVWPFARLELAAGAMFHQVLPSYSCAPLRLKSSSARVGWWSKHGYISGALETPLACLRDLESHVKSSGHFTSATCNAVDHCWIASTRRAKLTLLIRPDSVSYTYIEAEGP